ncbi:MAG TPA: IclR family transcriptional regulator C-terminal domain-containing protein [Streptosporangiaceae bacterium]|nr:IclR family transcriptional regulator C-terminal domain-containing protein [Streptosporangiaceae bacterium]
MTTSGRRANTSGTGEPSAAGIRPAAGTDMTGDDVGKHGGGQQGAASDAAAPSGRDSDFVQSLDRGLAVIRAFGPGRERLSLSDVARETGLTRAAARRFLLTLVKLGYVRSDGREFSLRPLVLELGYAYLSGLAMPEIASPHLEELVARVRESSSISVLDGHQIVYVARVPTKRIMTVAISVGTRFPAYATSMGRVLLAGLNPDDLDKYLAEADFEAFTARTVTDPERLRELVREVGRQGYAIVDQELEEGLRAIAAPIHGAGNAVIAAINLSAHASRVSLAAMRAVLLPALLETASRIEADLRSQGAT